MADLILDINNWWYVKLSTSVIRILTCGCSAMSSEDNFILVKNITPGDQPLYWKHYQSRILLGDILSLRRSIRHTYQYRWIDRLFITEN